MNEKTGNNHLSVKLLLFFNIISSIYPITLFAFPNLINNFGSSSWFLIILLIFISILFLFFFKGFNKEFNAIKFIHNNIFIKLLLSIYIIFVISILNISGCLIIKKFFYTNISVLFLSIINIITAIILSLSSPKRIISTSLVFFFFILFLYLIPITSTINRTLSFLFPIKVDIKNLSKIILVLLFPLESTLMLVFNNQTKDGIKRKHLIISVTLILVSLLFITIDSITLLSPNFLKQLDYSSFYRWNFLSSNIIIQNFDIVIFIILFTTLIFRLSYYIKILKISLKIKEKNISNVILIFFFSIILFVLNINTNNLSLIFDKLVYFMFFIIFLIFIIFTFKSMEVKND